MLDIRDVHDAHVVLEAVRLNILPLLKRRLLASERDELKSGHVYVWEEAFVKLLGWFFFAFEGDAFED